MKFLKTYEYWTTNVTDNINVNYGDKGPEISNFVKNIIDYIEKNFNSIKSMSSQSGYEINFIENNSKIKTISFGKTTNQENVVQVKLPEEKNPYDSKYITDDEIVYMKNKFMIIQKKFRDSKTSEREDKLSDIIDPLKVDAKKYNI